MARVPYQSSHTGLELKPAPITPAWVIEGAPQARATELMRSRDGIAYTVVWDCTAGKFNWTYHVDETIHILEGSIVLTDGGNAPTRFGPGDVIFFPKGSQVHWEVESYVKKVAFFRRVMPNPVNVAYRILRAAKMKLKGGKGAASDPMGVGASATPAA